ncbi:UNVERIFIED_CONTAM: hypothetical protein FKN15_020613 [Acipenser sinensis]
MDSVKQSAALCLLRLYKTSPDLVHMGEWTSRVVHLLNDQHMGVVTAAISLITCLSQKNPDEFKTCVSLAVSRLSRVLKVAVLAEKYAVDYSWYVDTILNLIRIAGDYVSEEVWYRVIQIVINRDDVQGYAAKTVFEALQAPACHENMVKVGGYILGEFGNLIAGDPRSSPLVQFNLLHSKFHLCSVPTRALLLSAYIKFINLFPETKPTIQEVLRSDSQIRNSDVELQQRAVEYLKLSSIASTDVLVRGGERRGGEERRGEERGEGRALSEVQDYYYYY